MKSNRVSYTIYNSKMARPILMIFDWLDKSPSQKAEYKKKNKQINLERYPNTEIMRVMHCVRVCAPTGGGREYNYKLATVRP